jgi:hypothetical protein
VQAGGGVPVQASGADSAVPTLVLTLLFVGVMLFLIRPLSPTVFTMMVIMALVTTAMTGPMLSPVGYKPIDPAH